MKSQKIKILHRAAGRPIIDYVLELAAEVCARPPVVIVGHQRDEVQQYVGERARFAVQEPPRGTGDAAMKAQPFVSARNVLILSGDVPLARVETLQRLLDEHARQQNALTMLTMRPADPAKYGRIVRAGDGSVLRIVEAKDASDEEKRIDEVNAGMYVFDAAQLFDNLQRITPNNAQGEYYLTDVVSMIRDNGKRVGAVVVDDELEALGVDSRSQLARAEAEIQRRVVEKLMSEGVTFRNPATVVIDSTVSIGADSVVYPFVTLEGKTSIGRDCVIEPNVHLIDTTVGNDVHVKTGTVADGAIVDDE